MKTAMTAENVVWVQNQGDERVQFVLGTDFLNGKGAQSIRTENINAVLTHYSVCIDIRY